MAWKICFESGRGSTRLHLPSAGATVGSSYKAQIRLDHPTVSRLHARLIPGPDGVRIEDLGSTNGTFVNGRQIVVSSMASESSEVLLGGLSIRLIEVDDRDVRSGVGLAPRIDLPRQAGNRQDRSTVETSILDKFTLKRLPALIESVAAGRSRLDLAIEVAHALYEATPSLVVVVRNTADVEVIRLGQCTEEQDADGSILVAAGDGQRFEILMPSAAMAEAYRPLINAVAGLTGLGASPATESHCGLQPLQPLSLPSLDCRVQEIYRQAARVAPSDLRVLIRGESGTGKEILARALHRASKRASGPFVALNCAALSQDLLDAELFGVERGAATGVEARPGRFELADTGTLFLDEIGDMHEATQARMLRVLAEGEVLRVGGTRPTPVDVRVLSATNRDLDLMMRSGDFRSDLFFRIADWEVKMPPLRQRRIDIANLAGFFLAQACEGRDDPPRGISEAAIDALRAHDWPGNIRQLQREVGRAALFVECGELLDLDALGPRFREARQATRSLKERLEAFEQQEIRVALTLAGGDMSLAADDLEIALSTLYRRAHKLGVPIKD